MLVYIYMDMYRVQSEVDKVLGTKDHVSVEDLEKLEYTEQVQYYYHIYLHSCMGANMLM